MLPTIQCPIGRKTTSEITIENPVETDIELTVLSSDAMRFGIVEKRPVVKANSTATFEIWHSSTSVGERIDGEITLSSQLIGDWTYIVSGIGSAPEAMPTTVIHAPINTHLTRLIKFVNPFSRPVSVEVSMKSESKKHLSSFRIFSKKTKYVIAGNKSIQIPICFMPKAMEEYRATLILSRDEQLSWRFPIIGTSLAPVSTGLIEIKCQARKVVEKIVPLNLDSIEFENQSKPENFRLEVSSGVDPKNAKDLWKNELIDRCITAELVEDTLVYPNKKLLLKVVFEPLRTIHAPINFLVYKKSGGCWKFNINLVATEPEIDDAITITGKLGVSTSVAFGLNNMLEGAAKFEAFFSVDSPPEYTVRPHKGV